MNRLEVETFMNHIYQDQRCVFCNSNSLDVALYDDDEKCPEREEDFVYTTETGDEGPRDKRFAKRYDFFGYKIDLSNVQEGYDLFDEYRKNNS